MKHKNKTQSVTPAYATFALADIETRDPETGTTNPSDAAVDAAKEFVDTNKK